VRHLYCIPLFAAFFTLTGCGNLPSTAERIQHIASSAAQHGWKSHIIEGEQFDLLAFLPPQDTAQSLLTIYIEGDGNAWKNRFEASDDPTPVKAIALALALLHPGAVYLSRPCQSIKGPLCTPEFWTSGRFSEPVINATNKAIDNLKARYQADALQLIGYSGGGSVAALIAARRSDVKRLVTVAGNLDHGGWTKYHGVSALLTSLNPADFRESLKTTTQYHLVGQDDKIVPPQLAQDFIAKFSPTADIILHIVPDFDHHCCWQKQWRTLLKEIDRNRNTVINTNDEHNRNNIFFTNSGDAAIK
jgi:dienelactone hydrolase